MSIAPRQHKMLFTPSMLQAPPTSVHKQLITSCSILSCSVMSYHWRSSDARELFEKTVLRRVSLVVLVVLWMSPASTGRLVIDQHCLHGQYHSLFTNTTCVQVRHNSVHVICGKLTPGYILTCYTLSTWIVYLLQKHWVYYLCY